MANGKEKEPKPWYYYASGIAFVAVMVGVVAGYFDFRNNNKFRLECVRAGKEVRIKFGGVECIAPKVFAFPPQVAPSSEAIPVKDHK